MTKRSSLRAALAGIDARVKGTDTDQADEAEAPRPVFRWFRPVLCAWSWEPKWPWGITYAFILGRMNTQVPPTYVDVYQGYRVLTHSPRLPFKRFPLEHRGYCILLVCSMYKTGELVTHPGALSQYL